MDTIEIGPVWSTVAMLITSTLVIILILRFLRVVSTEKGETKEGETKGGDLRTKLDKLKKNYYLFRYFLFFLLFVNIVEFLYAFVLIIIMEVVSSGPAYSFLHIIPRRHYHPHQPIRDTRKCPNIDFSIPLI